ncbi:unnamed protein product [Acanthoscelides obtectus]|uniref:Uncharacterized protein n=1 Tax=Acanthoscelides obtectus TaxID=200917 RepID=A0A9P0MN19_ACAOB|nr:unnamed protein product [Acanthoscelides obtectus]CAK1626052.1 hypothetical protein AOBTE_LOCUS3566 [Acanthoscelides obtectus]
MRNCEEVISSASK